MRTVFTALRHAISGGKNTVLVTILSHTGSAPRGAGSQMLVGKHGLMAGTVGGGAVEGRAIEEALRLRRFDGNYDFAFEWYQDPETVLLVDGKAEPYSYETLTNMYNYLNGKGELYFIEVNENGKWKPIGDVTFWQEDMPIVIGEREYRGKGIGKKVVSALVERGRTMGYDKLYVGEIYDFNIGSQKCFESVGFRSYEKTEKGSRYVLELK
mgnify:CR=1 FL=1